MWYTKIGLDTIDIEVKLVANYLEHLCLLEILLNNIRLSLLYLLLLYLYRRERFILLFLDLLNIGNYKLFPLFLVVYSIVIKVILLIRGI